jgi:hypothetical protein
MLRKQLNHEHAGVTLGQWHQWFILHQGADGCRTANDAPAGGGCHFQPGDMSLPHAITSAYAAQVCDTVMQ